VRWCALLFVLVVEFLSGREGRRMGACGSSASEEDARTAKIEKKMKMDAAKEAERIKLLLLGAGESGKSTIFKQMRILYGKGLHTSPDENERWKMTVYNNILSNFKILLDNVESFDDESLEKTADEVKELPYGQEAEIDSSVAEMLKALWNDPGTQRAWRRRETFQVQDALEYYLADENIDRIGADDFEANDQDILRTRVRTSGIVEESFNIDGVEFVFFDVGGQRNERKKWIHAFDNVTAVIFVAAINEYNQVLFEDYTMNRIDEAVILFDEISNSPFFTSTSMILFLNKSDLFEEKLTEVPFKIAEGRDSDRFTDYQGPELDYSKPIDTNSAEFKQVVEATQRYLLQLFINRNKNKKRDIYSRVTCATDTENVQLVWNAVRDIILRQNLQHSGFHS